jgi:hypothetical protein
VYVEGFIIVRQPDLLTHHAWVRDRQTGERHEVTIKDGDADPDSVYIGRELTKEELRIPDGPSDRLRYSSGCQHSSIAAI